MGPAGRRRTAAPPTRSGPEGSSRNGLRTGRRPVCTFPRHPKSVIQKAGAPHPLAKALPKDLRGMLGDDPATQAAIRDALLQEGAAEVLAHLHGLEDDA